MQPHTLAQLDRSKEICSLANYRPKEKSKAAYARCTLYLHSNHIPVFTMALACVDYSMAGNTTYLYTLLIPG